MLSNIKFTAPQYIVDDKDITIQVSSVKNGVASDPIEFTLTAQAIAPVAPDYSGDELTGGPASFIEFDVGTEPNSQIEIVSCTNGKASVNESTIKLTLDDLDADADGVIVIKAKRGKFESAETTISFKILITEPQAPVVEGPAEVKENEVANFTAEIESDCKLTAESSGGDCAVTDDNRVVFTPAKVTEDSEVEIVFTATRKSKTASITKSILVKNVLEPSAKLELVDNQVLRVEKDKDLVIAFKNANGVLAVTNSGEYYGTAVVESNTIKVSGLNAGSINLKVTQTETDKSVSEALDITVEVFEYSAKLVANASNANSVEIGKTIDLSFDNVSGEISAQAKNDNIEVAVVGQAVQVKGVKEGTGTLEVSQTEDGKEPSEVLSINIAVEAAQIVQEKSATLQLADSQAVTTDSATPLDIQFANLAGTLAAEITSGSEFGSIAVEADKITLTPAAEGTIVISATQTEENKLVSEALEISISITA